jgi:PAS domain S-box-containing protein
MSTDSVEQRREQAGRGPYSEAQFKALVEVIARSHHNHRDLIDNLDQAVFTLSLEGEVRLANRRLAETLGVSFPDLIGHRLSEFVDAPRLDEVAHSIPGFVKKGSWAGTVAVRFKRDSAVRFFECWLQAVVEDGQVAMASGWARDVTTQHESEIRFTDLFQSLQEGIFFTTLEGQVVDANPALIRMLGYDTKEDLQAHNFREVFAVPSDRDAIVRDLAEGGSFQDRELMLRRKDGKQIHCLVSGFAIRDPAGRLVRLQGTLVDITERREMESKLRLEQEFVRRLVASFPDSIAVFDRDGRFVFVSERMEDILGVSPEQYIGEPIGWRTDPADRAKLTELFLSIMSGRKGNAQVEFRGQHTDGTWRVLRVSASPLFDEAGKISGMVSSSRDVTEAIQVEQQLLQKEKFTAMGQMMAGAAHELNNPLTAILGVSELLRERAPDPETQHHLDLIVQQSRRAASIVQNLLAFARPPAQGRSKIRLDEVVQEALRREQSALSQKNITVEWEPTGDMAAIEGDRKLLLQVFLNIITNAEQSISSAHDHGTLKVSLARVDAGVRVTFADDGPGIAPENMAKIFDPFFTTKRPGGGTGLGLTICLAVTKEHGGTIEAQSTPGGGARFQVLFPVAGEDLPKTTRATPRAESSLSGSAALRGHTILIVDDEESIREIVSEGLLARGMRVHAAESSEAALSYLSAHACEIVLCDSNLPGLRGEQLFERLRATSGNSMPYFVFMTGDLVDSTAAAGLGETGARVLQKPFHVAALATLLVEVLEPRPSPVP